MEKKRAENEEKLATASNISVIGSRLAAASVTGLPQ